VRLFKATGEGAGAVHFNLLHRQTLNRVRQVYRDPDDGEVQRKDLARGFQIKRDRYVVVEYEELKKLKVESTKVIDIERFVGRKDIDRLFWEDPCYLVPDGKPAQEPFAVIREAMASEAQVALGRLVMTNRERMVAIEVRGKGLLLTRLRSHGEMREEAEFFDAIPDVKISPQMIEVAKQIIAQQHGRFDPAEFRDRYHGQRWQERGGYAMPWGEGPGPLPPLRPVNGQTLVRLVIQTQVHHVTAADEVGEGEAHDAWHDFADLMRDVADSVADLDAADRGALGRQVDAAIAELHQAGARVIGGVAGAILYVAVLPKGYRRNARVLFAAS
jgi:DNA end-binding protein Ku